MGLINAQMLQAIGSVAVHAAVAEQMVHVAYWRYAGLDNKVGQVITENMRPKRVLEDLIKIVTLLKSGAGRIADIKDIAHTYGNLAQQRNEIIHWIWDSNEDDTVHKVIPPGYMSGKSPRHHSKPYTEKQIKAIGDGLRTIARRLQSHLIKDQDILALRAVSRPGYVLAPWLDKPSQQDPKR